MEKGTKREAYFDEKNLFEAHAWEGSSKNSSKMHDKKAISEPWNFYTKISLFFKFIFHCLFEAPSDTMLLLTLAT